MSVRHHTDEETIGEGLNQSFASTGSKANQRAAINRGEGSKQINRETL